MPQEPQGRGQEMHVAGKLVHVCFRSAVQKLPPVPKLGKTTRLSTLTRERIGA
jgi:hypothetical protein